MNSINSNFDLPNQPEYFKNFWDYARGREDSDAFLEAGKKPSGSYVLPTSSATKYDEALKRESLFRTIGTYVYSHKGPSKLLGKHTTDAAAWVPDGEAIPIYDGINDFTEFAMEDHKLAAIMRMGASFLQDNPHVFGDYFMSSFRKRRKSPAVPRKYRPRVFPTPSAPIMELRPARTASAISPHGQRARNCRS